jgi:acyl carrier protein
MKETTGMQLETLKAEVKEYILNQFLPGESPDALTESTPLITGGILDSIATLKLVGFLEERFRTSFDAHEVDADHLDTIEMIAALVMSKSSQG